MPIEATSNAQSLVSAVTLATICSGVRSGPRLESAPFAAVCGEEQLDVRAPHVHGENRPTGHGSSFDTSRPACKSNARSGGDAASSEPRANPADVNRERPPAEGRGSAAGWCRSPPGAGRRRPLRPGQARLVVVQLRREHLSPAAAHVARSPNSGQANLLRIKAARACRRSGVDSRAARSRTSEMTYASWSPESRSTIPSPPQRSQPEEADREASEEKRQRERRVHDCPGDGKRQRQRRQAEVLALRAAQLPQSQFGVFDGSCVHGRTNCRGAGAGPASVRVLSEAADFPQRLGALESGLGLSHRLRRLRPAQHDERHDRSGKRHRDQRPEGRLVAGRECLGGSVSGS